MKKTPLFCGVATALITPFRDGEIDYPALDALIERQIAAGIDALVIGGTTGEAATLSDTERYRLYERAICQINRRTKVLLGTGTNDTAVAVAHTRRAALLGADGALVVTPYYNKGTREGIVTHYLRIAEASDMPIVLYNVPSRTGVDLTLRQLECLGACDNIAGIKEAGDSADRLVSLAALNDTLPLYAGNDSTAYTVLSLGGHGVISVASNLCPKRILRITGCYFSGRQEESLAEQIRLLPLIHALFLETNPAPVKYAAACLGYCRAEVRLPLTEPAESTKASIREILRTMSP